MALGSSCGVTTSLRGEGRPVILSQHCLTLYGRQVLVSQYKGDGKWSHSKAQDTALTNPADAPLSRAWQAFNNMTGVKAQPSGGHL